jgi:parallel beta-helix repeat protein
VTLARLLGLAVLLASSPAFAGASGPFACEERTPRAITVPGAAGEKCQQAISKEGAKFLKTKTAALSKCLLKSAPGVCPEPKDVTKMEQAAAKASEKIAKACADDASQQALGNAYATVTDENLIGSCMLSQHNAMADLIVAEATGVNTQEFLFEGKEAKARKKCIAEANKSGVGFALGVVSAMQKCIDGRIKNGPAENIEAACVGSFAGKGAAYTPPTDAKTAAAIEKLRAKTVSKIDAKCGPGVGSWLPSVFACGGAESAAELESCLLCEGWNKAVSIVEQQYAEDADAFVVPGLEAIQDAVDALTPGGGKLLITSGTYPDPATIAVSDLQLVGCGGATNDRPNLEPATPDVSRGIQAAGQTDLTFQSLEVRNWDDDGIFVQQGTRLVFRDLIGDGAFNSTYAVFPVTSNGVLVEGCTVTAVADAGIYVGQSENIVVRHNRVVTSVAGIEIENSGTATVQNNYATDNTGGLLVFKAEGLPVQLSDDHVVSHNVLEDNNRVNIGSGTVGAVPDGTGVLIISNDDSVFEYNLVTGNNTFGIAVIDQGAASQDLSPDPKSERNLVRRNVVTGNGTARDTTEPNDSPFGGDLALAILDKGGPPQDHDNCIADDNVFDLPIVFGFLAENMCPTP